MGLFEFFGVIRNPGKIGDIQKNNEPLKEVDLPILIIKLIVSIIIVYGLFYITVLNNFNFSNTLKFVIILFIYCFIGYRIIPKPDTSNVGLLGGLIDHPFRFSDDLNRFLVVFLVLMYPGRFISTTVLQMIGLIKGVVKK